MAGLLTQPCACSGAWALCNRHPFAFTESVNFGYHVPIDTMKHVKIWNWCRALNSITMVVMTGVEQGLAEWGPRAKSTMCFKSSFTGAPSC